MHVFFTNYYQWKTNTLHKANQVFRHDTTCKAEYVKKKEERIKPKL